MNVLIFLVPAALLLGLLGLIGFLWSLRTGQYDDLEGAAERILFDENEPEQDERKD
ncbi:cbb3-type cytochrome oxidase assembly protein CcoS [Parvibaculum sp.]|jgi:cbb3-type cytochrome oxidase maturation protein|uniref:cbb3-type cytochrome oxidase assembly protein CcoS n=1 Tax=Parvibaculum sp. TaxID=2024848 RepID=UPI002FD8D4BB